VLVTILQNNQNTIVVPATIQEHGGQDHPSALQRYLANERNAYVEWLKADLEKREQRGFMRAARRGLGRAAHARILPARAPATAAPPAIAGEIDQREPEVGRGARFSSSDAGNDAGLALGVFGVLGGVLVGYAIARRGKRR
jgi:hypothetical protein